MDLKVWSPLFDTEKEWRIDLPRFLREGGFRPSIDVVKKDGRLSVTAEVPGMSADDVEVTLDDGMLVIKGEKTEKRELSDQDRFMSERVFGAFQRRITVPDGVTADGIEATVENGILTVAVKLPEEKLVEPQRIPVAVK
jgi:HSP20 family protein